MKKFIVFITLVVLVSVVPIIIADITNNILSAPEIVFGVVLPIITGALFMVIANRDKSCISDAELWICIIVPLWFVILAVMQNTDLSTPSFFTGFGVGNLINVYGRSHGNNKEG